MLKLQVFFATFLVLPSVLSAAPQTGSDSCSTPDLIPLGTNGVIFDNTAATTGVEGQGWAMCDFTVIKNDVWFLWTAPATGKVNVITCHNNPAWVIPRIAVYPGSGCPSSIPVECTTFAGCEDLGGFVSFEAEQGSQWLVQVGSIPGSPAGTGPIWFTVSATSDYLYRYDASPYVGFSTGLSAPGEFLWMNRFNAKGGTDTLVQIDLAIGDPISPVLIANGAPLTVAVWSDPNQDGNPNDAQLLANVSTVVEKAHTGLAMTVFLPEPVAVQGKFFVGAKMAVSPGQAPGVIGIQAWGSFSAAERAWTASSGGTIDLNCLGCLNPPPQHSNGTFVNLFVRAIGGADSNTYCFGDGSGASCPCGNPGASDEGCANSSGKGAILWSTGSTKASTNDFALRATHLPPAGGIGLAIAGSQQQAGGAGIPFQDGLLCVGGTLWRYPAQAFTDSIVQTSVVGASNGLITAGSTWNFQIWYRDVVGVCGGSTGNLSNALQVNFKP